MWSPSEVTKELAGSSVTHSKEPVLVYHQFKILEMKKRVNALPATVDKYFVIPDRRIYRLKLFVEDETILLKELALHAMAK